MRSSPVGLVLVLVACTQTAPQPPERAPADAPPEQPEQPARPERPQSVAPPEQPDAPPTAAPPQPAPSAASEFHVVAARNGDLQVYDVGELIVGGAGALARVAADGSLERIDALRGLVDPGIMMLAGWELMALGGRWPDPVWMQTQTHYQRTSAPSHMYYRKGDRWQRKATAVGPLHWFYGRFTTWSNDQVLALRMLAPDDEVYEKYGDEVPPAVQKKLDDALAANPPRLDVLAAGVAPVPAPMQLAPGGVPQRLATAPTGELHVLLQFKEQRGEDTTYDYAVQRFAPGDATGTLHPLADVVRAPVALAVRADGDVLVGGRGDDGRGKIVRLDGATWTALPSPPSAVHTLAPGEPGVLWAVTASLSAEEDAPETELWRQVGAAAWARVPLPPVPDSLDAGPTWKYVASAERWTEVEPAREAHALAPQQVIARGRDVWVSGSVRGVVSADGLMVRSAVLRTAAPARTLEFPDDGTLRGELLDVLAAEPWRPGVYCEGLAGTWVVVERLTADAVPDPALVDSLRAAIPEDLHRSLVELREARVEGQRVVGLLFEPDDLAAADRLLAALAKFRPGVARRLECRDPRPLRDLGKFQ